MNNSLTTHALRWQITGCIVILAILSCVLPVAALDTAEGALPAAMHINISVANNPAGNYIKFDGGGLNALHVSTSPAEPYGQVTVSTDQSGTFYFSDTGGRGFFDDLLLLVAVNGEVPDNFRIHVRSSGYRWAPTGEVNQPPAPADLTYVVDAINATFTKDDLVYGPQSWKPAGMNSPMNYPLFFGQDPGDPNTRAKLMFIDLKVGAIGPNSLLKNLTDNGFAQIEYSVENLDTYASLNAYGWCNQSNQGKGITWTNQIQGEGSSGYTVLGTQYISHRSEFAAPMGTAVPHENRKTPGSGANQASAGSPATTAPATPSQKSPAGAVLCLAALGLILATGKRR